MSHQAWSTEEGLPDPSVHQVLQAKDGYLWLATEGGIVRFDGQAFRTYDHPGQPAFPSHDISSIAQDRSGTLWFGTADGLLALQGAELRRFSTREGLPSNAVLDLAAPQDGTLFVLTSRGLAHWTGMRFEVAAGVPPLRSLFTAQNGAIGAMAMDGSTLVYDRGSLRPGQASLPLGEEVLGAETGPDSTVWTYSAHQLSLVATTFRRTLTVGRELSNARITSVFVDRQGEGWIGTSHGLFTMQATAVSSVQPVESLANDSILSMMQDREGDLWIGTEGSGLHVLRPRKFATEPASQGEGVTALAVISDDLAWFGTRNSGVSRLQAGHLDQPVAPSALTSPVILSLAKGDQGDLWAGTPDGLNHITGARVERFTSAEGLPDDFVRSVLVDAHGAVWAGTRRGLAELNHGQVKTYTQAEGLGSNSIGPLLDGHQSSDRRGEAQEDLWIGTARGLSHLKNGHVQSFVPHLAHNATILTALAQVRGGLFLTAVEGGGLAVFDGVTFSPVPSPGLPSHIAAISLDLQHYVWLRGSQAVYRVSLDGLLRCARDSGACNESPGVYGTADGLPGNAAEPGGSPQLAQSPSGHLWVATRKGIGIADTLHLPVNNVPPPVALERFTVDGAGVPLGPAPLQIGPGHSRYAFTFVALSYMLPSKVRYRYKLEGLDRDWVDAGAVRTADYTSLPPKQYRFRVQAENNDGLWSETGVNFSFRVLPPFYRRWWFGALVLLASAAFVLLLLRFRERVVQRRFKLVLEERNRMAREIHDTLAQDFVSVSLQLDIASGLLKANQSEQALSQLQTTRRLVKDGLQAARQSIWNLRASAGEDSLPTRLSHVLQRFPEGNTRRHLTMGGAFRKLPDQTEAEVLRIAQECISNANRHAEADNLRVALFYEPQALLLTIEDDGKGFVVEQGERREGHYGLRGLRERAARLGATLTITSSPGEGAHVHMRLAIPMRGVENE